MALITVQRTGELIQALFRILEKEPDGMKAKEALAALSKKVSLTEYEAWQRLPLTPIYFLTPEG